MLCSSLQQAAISAPLGPTQPTSAWNNRLLAYPLIFFSRFLHAKKEKKQWPLYSLLPGLVQAPGVTRVSIQIIITVCGTSP